MNTVTNHLAYQFSKGSEKAFEKIYNILFSHFNYITKSIIQDDALAEDIVLEVFQKLWVEREKIGTAGQIVAFLKVAIKNASINNLKAKQRLISREKQIIEYQLNDIEESVEVAVIKCEVILRLRAEINLLPKKCRAIMLLKLDGKSHKEISILLNITEALVRNHFQIGKKTIKQKMGSFYNNNNIFIILI